MCQQDRPTNRNGGNVLGDTFGMDGRHNDREDQEECTHAFTQKGRCYRNRGCDRIHTNIEGGHGTYSLYDVWASKMCVLGNSFDENNTKRISFVYDVLMVSKSLAAAPQMIEAPKKAPKHCAMM